MNIREAIQKISKTGEEVYCKICKVDAVNTSARTVDVTPIDESAPLLGVNLQANQDASTGVVFFPKVDSHVAVAFLDASAAVVILTEEIDKALACIGDDKPVELEVEKNSLKITIGDTSIELDGSKKITFNGGDNGGLVVLQELKDSLDSVKQYCETMNTAVSTGIKAVGAALQANGATGAAAFDAAMAAAKIIIKPMENKNIKH